MTVTVNMEEVMEIESTMGKGTRKPQDLNAPKRPMSSFFLWANKMRPSIAEAHPEWGVAQVGKELGSMWKKVPKSEVAGFQAQYEKAKKTYDAKFEKYKKSSSYKNFQTTMLAWKIHQTKKPFRTDSNAPKRSLSAYMLYAASVRDQIVKENPDMTASEVMKEQSVWWKALSESQRQPWSEKSANMRQKYVKKMEKYQKTNDYQKYVADRDAYKAEMIAKRNMLMGIKAKRKRSSSKGDGEQNIKKAKRSSSSKRRSAKSPKSSKKRKSSSARKSSKRSSSRRARTPKAPKGRRRKRTSRRGARRATRRARAPKKSSNKRTRRAKTPKSPKRRSKSKVSTRRSSRSRRSSKSSSRSRRARTPKSSKKSSKSVKKSSRKSARRSKTPKAPKRSKSRSARSKSSKRKRTSSKSASRRSSRRSKTPKRKAKSRSASRSKSSRRSKTPKRRRSAGRKKKGSKKRASATPAAPSVLEVDTEAESSAM